MQVKNKYLSLNMSNTKTHKMKLKGVIKYGKNVTVTNGAETIDAHVSRINATCFVLSANHKTLVFSFTGRQLKASSETGWEIVTEENKTAFSSLSNYELTKQLRQKESKALKFQEIAERTKSEAVRRQSLKSAEKYLLNLDELRLELENRLK